MALIDRSMRQPLSAPPGKSGRWVRRAPLICVGVVYAVWLVATALTYLTVHGLGAMAGVGHSLAVGGVFAYGVGGLLLMLLPPAITAGVLAHERDSGTMEALVLTPLDRDRLARGRFWHAAWPWLQVFLWLLPVYLCLGLGVSGIFGAVRSGTSGTKEFMGLSVAYVFVPKIYACMFAGMGLSEGLAIPCWGVILTLLRICRDMIDVMAALGISYYFSARMHRGVHAMLLSVVTVPACMLTIFLAPEWISVGVMIIVAFGQRYGSTFAVEAAVTLYALGGIAMSCFELWLCFALVRRVSRRFDEYAVGEISGF